MNSVLTIPGVKLEVYKENRQLIPESDGYVGELFSGSATILAVVEANADKTIGLFRDGQDHYIGQKDWLLDPDRIVTPDGKKKQIIRREFLAERSFDADTKVYGVRMPLKRVQENLFNTVHYPENMLALAQYVQDAGQLTGRVHVWEVALVSQNGEFFLTVHRHYNISACRSIGTGRICFPRLSGHRLLERILVDNAPEDLPLTPAENIVPLQRPQADASLGRYEGIVENWYAPRSMGSIITAQGNARVHWKDIPRRPRLRFLQEGERVRFAELQVPAKNPATDWRKMRKARFELQACGIEVNS